MFTRDGRAVVVVRSTSGAVLYRSQDPSSGSGWGNWVRLGGAFVGNPAAATMSDGRIVIAARGTDNVLRTTMQHLDATWTPWTPLGTSVLSEPSLIQNAAGGLELFVRGPGNHLLRSVQAANGSWGAYSDLGGTLATEPVAVKNADGRLEIFAIQAPSGAANDPDSHAGPVVHLWQLSDRATWGAWASRGGVLTATPAVALNNDGTLEVFARDPQARLQHSRRTTSWSGWSAIGGTRVTIKSGTVVGKKADGRLELFVRGSDDAAYHSWNSAANSASFNSWQKLPDVISSPEPVLDSTPSVTTKSDGSFELHMRDKQGRMCSTHFLAARGWLAWTCLAV